MRRFGFFLALRLPVRYGRSAAIAGCGSSVVEHSLGKGEVESSILSCSTISSRCPAKLNATKASADRHADDRPQRAYRPVYLAAGMGRADASEGSSRSGINATHTI